MALRLRVTGPKAAALGEHATRVFGVHGGRLGRASDNDWALPDPERFLSGHHAKVEYRAGDWFVVDTSSNGTFLNDSMVALGKDNAHRLTHGDRLRMGEYELLVIVSPDNDFPPDADVAAAFDDEEAALSLSLSTHGDLGAAIDLARLLSDPMAPPDDLPPRPDPVRAADSYGQILGSPASRPDTRPEPPRVRTINAPPRTEQGNGHGPAFQAFCRGAGLDPGALSIEQATAALSLAGQLVRELALGLITAQQNRVESTGRFPLEDTAARRAEQNPFKLGASVDEVLARLFGPRSTRFLPPLDAVRSSFTELRRHEQASQLAMQTALAEFLRRLEPAHLEPRFVEALKRSGPLPAQPGQKYWDMYGEIYRVLAQISPNGLPHAFAEEYARAYEKTLAELSDGDRRPGASVGDSRRAP